MSAIYIVIDKLNLLKDKLSILDAQENVKSILFLMADAEHLTPDILNPILKTCSKPIIGGIFPELIYEGRRKASGILLLPLEFTLKTQLFDLSASPEVMMQQLEKEQMDSLATPSGLFVFADALSPYKKVLMESMFNFFGIIPSYVGGCAGSLSFKQAPCIINNEGMHQNAAVIGWASKRIDVGVAHGWHAISEGLKVTKVSGRVIESINWKPAFEVYKEIVEKHSGLKFNSSNFFEIAKAYPLGVARMDAEMVVRDPFMEENGHLHILDRVDEGEYIKILFGDIHSLLTGAELAREIAFSSRESANKNPNVFCIDCISRVLFMEEAFEKELKTIGTKRKVNGILSIGEIANSEKSFLEILNKTIVVGIW